VQGLSLKTRPPQLDLVRLSAFKRSDPCCLWSALKITIYFSFRARCGWVPGDELVPLPDRVLLCTVSLSFGTLRARQIFLNHEVFLCGSVCDLVGRPSARSFIKSAAVLPSGCSLVEVSFSHQVPYGPSWVAFFSASLFHYLRLEGWLLS